MGIYREIERLLIYGLKKELFTEDDKIFVRNSLLDILNLDSYEEIREEELKLLEKEELETPTEILNNILNYAYENKVLESNTPVYRDLLDTKIMAALMPRPSEVIRKFNEKYNLSKKEATDYFYKLSKACDYIRTDRIAQNMVWKSKTQYGDIDITINLSKPEKDPKAIAAAKNLPQGNYPKCLLCKENVGYKGRLNHPARQNLRIIPLILSDERWYLQYSPYSYYNEHCIVFSDKHEPMKITKKTFDRLLEFVEKFPHYFIGSNADLPIVGGSILTHDHYQGGAYEFPMNKAEDICKFNFNDISLSIVKWPLTVLRLKGKDRQKISELANKLLEHWRNYTDEEAGVYAETNNEKHNTITPIARREKDLFVLDLVLRNNRTSEEHPDGIFHPHKELHHIKKENIGLIEVLGLAVLPARLKDEMEMLKPYLLGEKVNIYEDEVMKIHGDWCHEIQKKHTNINKDNVDEIIRDEIGEVFTKVLEHCGVLKINDTKAIERYLDSLKLIINN
ncbi:UDP-glucose--hexose-1-phosphate uridylyltransferase [Caproiciproducens sp. MSJ-32]|uniref:UDP-glucose--hexose-1-phosphate uridylyltransferase n=1 Tax=Caproiciproducens sp. MSJ-32 TaxID=2841527 RepID=UPI001C1282E6|nr:UDP-glucose--hexose-1-phosphate uridylyltransferase [Caproiciproducens sp. MSJ-32]MBU5454489.1 UDP-glucose--hexose-1-phosphate uridylyltransferase [Caproiciproducens sp. MSJ-32]